MRGARSRSGAARAAAVAAVMFAAAAAAEARPSRDGAGSGAARGADATAGGAGGGARAARGAADAAGAAAGGARSARGAADAGRAAGASARDAAAKGRAPAAARSVAAPGRAAAAPAAASSSAPGEEIEMGAEEIVARGGPVGRAGGDARAGVDRRDARARGEAGEAGEADGADEVDEVDEVEHGGDGPRDDARDRAADMVRDDVRDGAAARADRDGAGARAGARGDARDGGAGRGRIRDDARDPARDDARYAARGNTTRVERAGDDARDDARDDAPGDAAAVDRGGDGARDAAGGGGDAVDRARGDARDDAGDDAGDDAAAAAAATEPAPTRARAALRELQPILAIAGGFRLESLQQKPGATAEARHPTVAVSRFGIRGAIGAHITFASALEASLGGGLGYGASVWEGQAELAVRDQWVRYQRGAGAIAVGRIVDEATFDFVSAHVGDLLYADSYTRDPLLYSGADRGTGLYGTWQLGPHLVAGLSFHSTNPTGLTGTLLIGGKLGPFDRPFDLAAAQVGRSQNSLPDQNLHIYFGTPSFSYSDDLVDVKAAAQLYVLDTQMAIRTDDTIRGYNLRGDVRVKLLGGRLRPFANVSRNENEILDTVDATMRLAETYRSFELSGGVDYDYAGKNGIGFQYAVVDSREPGQHTREQYVNLGTSYWLEPELAIGVRAAMYVAQISGETAPTGHRSLFVTMRLML